MGGERIGHDAENFVADLKATHALADSRDDAAKLCAQLLSAGGACIVQKN